MLNKAGKIVKTSNVKKCHVEYEITDGRNYLGSDILVTNLSLSVKTKLILRTHT